MRLIIFFIIMTLSGARTAGAAEELRILAGVRLIPDSVVERFEKEHGIRLKIEYFDSPESLAAYLSTRPAGDLALLREYRLRHLVASGQIAPLDHSLLPALENLSPLALNNQADPGCRHSLPYAVGTFGIIYRKDLMPSEPDSWSWLFGRFAGTVPLALSDHYRDVMCAALISQGYSCNSTSPLALEQTAEALRRMSKHPAYIGVLDNESMRLYLEERIVYAACTYNNVAARAMEEDVGLAFANPKGDTVAWSHMFVINSRSQNQKAAHLWLNFLLSPEVAAEISTEYRATVPNRAALARLPEAIRNNPVIYPPVGPEVRFQMPLGLEEESEKLYIDYWSRLKIK